MTDIVERLRSLNADFLHEEAADEIERLRAAVAAARRKGIREGVEAAAKAALGERISNDGEHAVLLMTEPHWSSGYNDGCEDCAFSIRAMLEDGR